MGFECVTIILMSDGPGYENKCDCHQREHSAQQENNTAITSLPERGHAHPCQNAEPGSAGDISDPAWRGQGILRRWIHQPSAFDVPFTIETFCFQTAAKKFDCIPDLRRLTRQLLDCFGVNDSFLPMHR